MLDKLKLFIRLLCGVILRAPARLSRADAYLNAWNTHDIDAIISQTGAGSYSDPLTDGAIHGQALRDHAAMLFKAFPDLRFELDGDITAGANNVAARYILHATHSGDLPGDIGFEKIDATGKTIALPGTIFFEFTANGDPAVENLFDQQAFGQALGFQGYIMPFQMGDYSFGAFYRLHRGNMNPPQAIGLTWLYIKGGDEQFQWAADQTRETLEHLSQNPGFVTGMVGARKADEQGNSYGFTLSAWEHLEDLDNLRPNEGHKKAVQAFMKEGLAWGTHSRVYKLVRTKPVMIACDACGKKNNAHNKTGKCSACGEALAAAPAYW